MSRIAFARLCIPSHSRQARINNFLWFFQEGQRWAPAHMCTRSPCVVSRGDITRCSEPRFPFPIADRPSFVCADGVYLREKFDNPVTRDRRTVCCAELLRVKDVESSFVLILCVCVDLSGRNIWLGSVASYLKWEIDIAEFCTEEFLEIWCKPKFKEVPK